MINLKDDDTVANFLLADNTDQIVAIITQRGAFKQMPLSEVMPTSRAKRGLQILRELKKNPHRIVAARAVIDGTLLDVLTADGSVTTINPTDHPTGDRFGNGSFVLDTDTLGEPTYVHTRMAENLLE
jgi:topoisomerase-4 subunit A